MSARSYVVGLPVVVVVNPDGSVEFEVDLCEVDDAGLLADGLTVGNDGSLVDEDAATIAAALTSGRFTVKGDR